VFSGAQTALLNGLHKIAELAKTSAYSSLGSMLISSLALWQLGEDGAIYAALSIPFSSLAASWLFSRKLYTNEVSFSWQRVYPPLRKMFSLGFVFMTTALMVVGNQFIVRVIITQKIGLVATGHFQAAWTISMLYLGFILSAMSSDYYPRLSAASHDNNLIRTLVNDQTEVALLLAAPVILGMITFTSLIINILYSPSFADSVKVLRWQLIGDVFKLATWSMGYILLGSNYGRVFFWAELSFHLVSVSIIWFGISTFGIEITGISFLIAYAYYFLLIWFLVKRLIGFSWDKVVIVLFVIVLMLSILTTYIVKLNSNMIFAVLITALVGIYSIYRLSNIAGGLKISKLFRRG
jgi:enterobacterial common antigen flippase